MTKRQKKQALLVVIILAVLLIAYAGLKIYNKKGLFRGNGGLKTARTPVFI